MTGSMSDELFRALENGNNADFRQAEVFISGLEESGKLDVLRSSRAGYSVLHFAIHRFRIKEVEFILGQLSDDGICILLAVKDNDGNCPLHVALWNLDGEGFQAIWNSIPDGIKLACAKICNSNGLTALHTAVSSHSSSLILSLLHAIPQDKRADFIRENVCHKNQTILHMAQRSQTFIRILEMTTESGQENLLTKWYFYENTIFWWIADSQRVEHLQAISSLLGINRWADLVDSPEGHKVLHHAVKTGRVNIVSCLIEGLERVSKFKILCQMDAESNFPLSIATRDFIRDIIAVVEGRNVDASVIASFFRAANDYSDHYVLHGKPRALVFYDPTDRLPEAEPEKCSMIEALKYVGIEDIHQGDLSRDNLTDKIEQAGRDGVSALLVCLMSHGWEGLLDIGPKQPSDEQLKPIQPIVSLMQKEIHDNNLQRPKVLILQACQGPHPVHGRYPFKLEGGHFIIVSSTLLGKPAIRYLFIPELAKAILQRGRKDHLYDICNRANRMVNRVCWQTPYFQSSSDKHFYFKWIEKVDQ